MWLKSRLQMFNRKQKVRLDTHFYDYRQYLAVLFFNTCKIRYFKKLNESKCNKKKMCLGVILKLIRRYVK